MGARWLGQRNQLVERILRRFFLHMLPKGFVRIQYFAFPREWIPRALAPALPATAGERTPDALRFLGDRRHMALPQLRRYDVCRSHHSPP